MRQTFTIEYIPDRHRLNIYSEGKLVAGMVGEIAHRRFKAIKKEMDRTDLLKQMPHGLKTKKKEV